MKCAACGRPLPAAFPGAVVECACGERIDVGRRPSSPRAPAVVPYRSASVVDEVVERGSACPFCSHPIGALARICLHCDVRLERVRCPRCFTLQAPGDFSCTRCDNPLPREPFLDATDAPCPCCATPLEAALAEQADARTHECPRCGGIFVSRDALAALLRRAEEGAPIVEPSPRSPARRRDGVTYLRCPLCHAMMNRTNFGKASGVVVDVCSAHGTWFDAGELTRVVAFVTRRRLASR